MLLISATAFSQKNADSATFPFDTLYFMNGEIKPVRIVDTANFQLRFFPERKRGKPKMQEVATGKVFSIKYSTGKEQLFYFYDSLKGNVFNVTEAKMYVLGEQEADKHYRNKWPFIIGFVSGVVSPLVLSNAVLLSPIAPAISPLHIYLPNIRVNTKKMTDRKPLEYDTFLMGYEKVARKKNFIRGLIGAGSGLAVGVGIWAILQ